MKDSIVPDGIELTRPIDADSADILSAEACAFVADLVRLFRPRVEECLAARAERRLSWRAGDPPSFLEETRPIREAEWTVAPLPEHLLDRRVEITGPVDRKMVINALNSGANCFMADFEDSNSPTLENCLAGQVNLRDAVHRTIEWTDAVRGKHYRLGDEVATLLVRPRGWHLVKSHFLADGVPSPAGLWDFGFYFFHNPR